MQMYNLIDVILSDVSQAGSNAIKQRKIIESAVELFSEKGYANTTTSEIAQMAGIAEGTLFRYYKTKDALLKALLIPFRQSVIPKISKEVLSLLKLQVFKSIEDFLTFFIKNRLEFIRENQKIFKVFVKELYYKEDFRMECLPQFDNDEIKEFANSLINKAKENGEIKNIPNYIIFRDFGIFSISYCVARFTILPQELFLDDDTEVRMLVERIMCGIRNN